MRLLAALLLLAPAAAWIGAAQAQTMYRCGKTYQDRIHTMITDLVDASATADQIGMSPEVFEAMGETRAFLFERVYVGRIGEGIRSSVEHVLLSLLRYFSEHSVPDPEVDEKDNPAQAAVDYVAGMTDRFALRTFERLMAAPAPDLSVLG